MPEIADAWLALFGAIFGGCGLKFLDHWLSRNKYKEDTATKFREELRTDMKSLRDEIAYEKKQGEEWRTKYYESMQEIYVDKKEHVKALARIGVLEDEVRDWKFKYHQLWEDMVVERDDRGKIPRPGSIEQVDDV